MVARVPAGWPALPVSGVRATIRRRRRSIRARWTRRTPAGSFAAESRVAVAGATPAVAQQGRARRPALRPERVPGGGATITIADRIASDTPQRSGGVFAAAGGVVAFRSASPDSRLDLARSDGQPGRRVPRARRTSITRGCLRTRRVSPSRRRTPRRGRHTIWILDRGARHRVPAPGRFGQAPTGRCGRRTGSASCSRRTVWAASTSSRSRPTAARAIARAPFAAKARRGHRLVARRTVAALPDEPRWQLRHSGRYRSPAPASHSRCSRHRQRDPWAVLARRRGLPTRRTNPARRKSTFSGFLEAAKVGGYRPAAGPSHAGDATARSSSISRRTAA